LKENEYYFTLFYVINHNYIHIVTILLNSTSPH